jgi:DNA-binding CsgD family transcriptional regulator
MVDEAGKLAETVMRALSGRDVPIDRTWAALNAARAHLIAGRLHAAVDAARDALAIATDVGLRAGRALAASVLAAASAQLGDAATCAQAARVVEQLSDVQGFLQAERSIGRAWAARVAGDLRSADDLLSAAAARARGSGQVCTESFVLHEQLRMALRADAVRLGELAAATDSPLVAARAAHAIALQAADSAGLERCAVLFEELGCMLAAAEAWSGAARACQSPRVATRLHARAAEIATDAGCAAAVTPLLMAGVAEDLGKLSRRQAEIAALAAAGASTKDISAALVLSPRTIDNHLQHIYTKLGVASRRELAERLSRQK